MEKENQEMRSLFRWIVVGAGVFIALLAFALESNAQSHEGFMYGKVYTTSNTYTGAIRWGSEEVLWTDLFNGAKTGDQFKKLVPEQKDDNDSWFDIDWSFGSIWEDKVIAHRFTIQFGNLTQVTPLADNEVRIKFKNGQEMRVDGRGYNDIGAKIQVIDAELGVVSLDWRRILKIEFLPTPKRLDTFFGMPLYGTVEGSRREKYTGFVIWDNDERLGTDKLDGDSDDGDVSLKFTDIASVERDGRGSRVTLKSGREIFLTGSNDVNDENRGVIVVTPDIGIVKFSWNAFRKVTFTSADNTGESYSRFTPPAYLQGTVSRLDGDDLTGRILFDIDEILDIEILEGEENDIEYSIPLRNIRKITPKNYDYSSVELRNGQQLLLGGTQDVSSKNGGVLVFMKGEKKPQYVSWKKINEITFH
jgi:hypothetical protein